MEWCPAPGSSPSRRRCGHGPEGQDPVTGMGDKPATHRPIRRAEGNADVPGGGGAEFGEESPGRAGPDLARRDATLDRHLCELALLGDMPEEEVREYG